MKPACQGFERLEPDAGKLARPVLRGRDGGNTTLLPDFDEGNYHCRHCGPGGGFKLLQACRGWNGWETLKHLETYLGLNPQARQRPAQVPGPDRMRRLAHRIWKEALPISSGDEVDRYLAGRGVNLDCYPKTLRFHPALGYYEKDPCSGKSILASTHPAMVACVQGRDGRAVNLHRTYLHNGEKAFGGNSKKVLTSSLGGEAVRFAEATDELSVSEGLENGLAVFKRTGQPLWVALNAGNLEKLWIPESVEHLRIYGDNDADSAFDGQASAYILARSFMKQGHRSAKRSVEVFIPRAPGADWAQVHSSSTGHIRRVV